MVQNGTLFLEPGIEGYTLNRDSIERRKLNYFRNLAINQIYKECLFLPRLLLWHHGNINRHRNAKKLAITIMG